MTTSPGHATIFSNIVAGGPVCVGPRDLRADVVVAADAGEVVDRSPENGKLSGRQRFAAAHARYSASPETIIIFDESKPANT
jgi:hypothetical protein